METKDDGAFESQILKEAHIKVHECRKTHPDGNFQLSIVWEPGSESFLPEGCQIAFFRIRNRPEETNEESLERLTLTLKTKEG